MALTLLVPGTFREVWREDALLDGGASRTIPTGVRLSTRQLPRVLATLYVTPVVGEPQITATVAVVAGLAVVNVQNVAAPGNAAIYVLDLTRLQSPQQGLGGAVGVVNVAMTRGAAAAMVGWALVPTDVNVAVYPVVDTDVRLAVRRTLAGTCQITLPLIATGAAGRVLLVTDSGRNAAINNITLVPAGADTINGVAGNYTMAVSDQTLWIGANGATDDWELL